MIKPIKLLSLNYPLEIRNLDIKEFPLIDDFSILVKERGQLGCHLYYISSQYGFIASFPWWDHIKQQLKVMDISKIPIGKIDNPFTDLEQSWQILIWEKRDYVYIMQGEEPCCTEFSIWFRVRKDKYIKEWENILRVFK